MSYSMHPNIVTQGSVTCFRTSFCFTLAYVTTVSVFMSSDLTGLCLNMYVTSFFSILYWNNSEYLSQKHSQSGSIHSINYMSMLQAWAC